MIRFQGRRFNDVQELRAFLVEPARASRKKRRKKNPLARFEDEEVRIVRWLWESGITQAALARAFGVTAGVVSRMCRRETYTRVT